MEAQLCLRKEREKSVQEEESRAASPGSLSLWGARAPGAAWPGKGGWELSQRGSGCFKRLLK